MKITKIFAKSSLNLGISQGMTTEYELRYKRKLQYFHNPIDLTKWKSKDDVHNNTDSIKLLYSGRIKLSHFDSLNDIGQCIEKLTSAIGRKVIFDIYSDDSNTAVAKKLKKYSGVNLKPFIPHHEMPNLLLNYDLLILPLDFSSYAIKIASLSFPTKLSEYMITGVPILVYAPEEMEIIKHSKTHLWGFNITKKDKKILFDGIKNAITNADERENKSHRAISFAQQNYDIKIISKRFKELIENACVQ